MSNSKLIITPKPPKIEDSHRIISLRIKINTYNRIDDVCVKSGINRNHLLNKMIEYALDNISFGE